MNKIIREKAYAKVNFTLDIQNKREDGYHNLKSIILPISLYDELTFEKQLDGVSIDMSNNNIELEKNIIYKTIMIMKDRFNCISGVKVKVIKNIPVEAGLAGGSADCAATIKGLNKLFELHLSLEQMTEIANELGSDTAFCILSKPAVMTGRGDFVEEIECNFTHEFLIVKPQVGMSTLSIFSNHTITDSEGDFDKVLKSLIENNKELLVSNWFNDLEQTVNEISNEMNKLRNDLLKLSTHILMSGSGSSIIVFTNTYEAVEKYANENNCQTFRVKIAQS